MGSKHILMRSCLGVALTLQCMLSVSAAELAANSTAKDGCQQMCGNVEIPYPFGIGSSSCFLDEPFEVVCRSNDTPLLKNFNNVEVTEIEFPRSANQENKDDGNWGYIHINNPIMASNPACASSAGKATTANPLDFTGSPFHFSNKNEFGASGCINQAWLIDKDEKRVPDVGCGSSCRADANLDGECCQKEITQDSVHLFNISFTSTDNSSADVGCRYAMIGLINQWLEDNAGSSCSSIVEKSGSIPALLEWGLKDSSNEAKALLKQSEAKNSTIDVETHEYDDGSEVQFAFCRDGFQGSAYVPDGCQDINECVANISTCQTGESCENTYGSYKCIGPMSKSRIALIVACAIMGVLLLILGVWGGFKVMKIRKEKKFFVENGGLLLKLSEGRTRLFKADELITATNNFSKKNLLGQGGQGTVYKGTLADGKTVAIKQCKHIQPSNVNNKKFKILKRGGFDMSRESGDEIQGGAFINEVILLSETIHKNIVKLLGCCLETESPLLVYEYLINGDLSHHLQNDRHHNNDDQFTLSWEMRLKIAAEVAEGLSYLHLQAGVGIYHRDVKTDNILLDNKYTPKLSDFGISKSVNIDHSHVSVVKVEGSSGYLDPEYMDTKHYTDKSDVYSFGVVLAEIITGRTPIFSYTSHETGEEIKVVLGYSFKEMETDQIMGTFLDARVKHQGKKSEVEAVINVAKRCLEKERKNRPKMKDVAMELEKIRAAQTNVYAEEIDEFDYELQSMEVMSTPPRDKEITRPLRVQGSQLSTDIHI